MYHSVFHDLVNMRFISRWFAGPSNSQTKPPAFKHVKLMTMADVGQIRASVICLMTHSTENNMPHVIMLKTGSILDHREASVICDVELTTASVTCQSEASAKRSQTVFKTMADILIRFMICHLKIVCVTCMLSLILEVPLL